MSDKLSPWFRHWILYAECTELTSLRLDRYLLLAIFDYPANSQTDPCLFHTMRKLNIWLPKIQHKAKKQNKTKNTNFIIWIKVLVWTCYAPSKKVWSATKNRIVFIVLSLVEFLLVMGGIMYLIVSWVVVSVICVAFFLSYRELIPCTIGAILRSKASKDCGPFMDVSYASAYDFIFKLRDEIFNTDSHTMALYILITSPGVVGFIFFIFL